MHCPQCGSNDVTFMNRVRFHERKRFTAEKTFDMCSDCYDGLFHKLVSIEKETAELIFKALHENSPSNETSRADENGNMGTDVPAVQETDIQAAAHE